MHTFKNYLTAYLLSLLLVVIAFGLIYIHISSTHEVFSHPFLRVAIITLAVIQAMVQLKFFLHLGQKQDGKANMTLIFLTLGLILIIVVGSIWIMNHLNYNMTPQQIQDYMTNQSTF
jgi:cytochrome o ubiquinol oxidase operon protein cyoD